VQVPALDALDCGRQRLAGQRAGGERLDGFVGLGRDEPALGRERPRGLG
jgi:hypothetical protein